MLKGNFVIGKPIVEQATRERLGSTIQDLIFTRAERGGSLRDRDCVAGFWVKGVEPRSAVGILPLGAVAALERDAIAVDAEYPLISSSTGSLRLNRGSENDIRDCEIVTLDGQHLGTASDVYFDPQTGAIEGYEVCGGLFADPDTGKSFVPATRLFEIARGVVGVACETVERMQEREPNPPEELVTPAASTAMIQKAYVVGKVAREEVLTPNGVPLLVSGQLITSAHAAVAQNRGVLDQLYRAAGGKTLEGPTEELPRAKDWACATIRPVEQAWGRRVRQMVQNQDGSIVAAPGQIVTEREIARAVEYRQERALLDAVGFLGDEEKVEAFCQACHAAPFCQTAFSPDAVSQSIDLVLNPFEPMVNPAAGGDLTANEQIQNALGRPVVRAIRDRENRLILEVGDLITYHAVEQAIRAEMLAKLLNSVYE